MEATSGSDGPASVVRPPRERAVYLPQFAAGEENRDTGCHKWYALRVRQRNLLSSCLRCLTRLYPLKSGSATFANEGWARRIAGGLTWPQTVRLRGGARVQVLNDYVGRAAYFIGDLDPKITYIARKLLRSGDCFLDVGANVGIVSVVAAQAVGPNGIVQAFEPQPRLAELLRDSLARNRYAQVHVHEIALSNRDGSMPLFIPSDNLGAASLEEGRGQTGPPVNVMVRHASDYLRSLQLPPVRLLKIDIEGHEGIFLAGASEYIRANPPSAILFEEHRQPALQADSLCVLAEMGYSVYGLPRALFSLRPEPVTVENQGSFRDYLGIHKDAPEILRLLNCRE
jgi:FkbM family methyltransferase